MKAGLKMSYILSTGTGMKGKVPLDLCANTKIIIDHGANALFQDLASMAAELTMARLRIARMFDWIHG
jgi:hypothetical protein